MGAAEDGHAMSKDSVDQWSTTAESNTDVAGIDIAEGAPAAGMNDALRAIMAQVRSALSPLSLEQGGTGAFSAGGARAQLDVADRGLQNVDVDRAVTSSFVSRLDARYGTESGVSGRRISRRFTLTRSTPTVYTWPDMPEMATMMFSGEYVQGGAYFNGDRLIEDDSTARQYFTYLINVFDGFLVLSGGRAVSFGSLSSPSMFPAVFAGRGFSELRFEVRGSSGSFRVDMLVHELIP